MDEVVRRAVLDRLDSLDMVAHEGPAEALLPVARDEMFRLSEGFRALLEEHRPDEDGRCRVCPATWRTRRWPCSVWTTAQRQLISQTADEPDSEGRPKHQRMDAETEPIPAVTDLVADPVTTPVNDAIDEEHPIPAPEIASPDAEHEPHPVGGHLETDHTRIHRASVVERDSPWPPRPGSPTN
jgi:hypothetical protein